MSFFKRLNPASSRGAPPPSDATSPSSDVPRVPRVHTVRPAQPIGYLKGRPGIRRNLWAQHPNRTTRKLRKILVSWEKLGFFLGFSGSPPRVSAATEKAFLKSKVAIAHSASFLRFVEGVGNVGREAHEMEGEFIRILERCPSLQIVSATTGEGRRELFYAWHTTYLFLHRVLGAYPYVVSGQTTPFPVVVPQKVKRAARKLGPLSERKMA